MRIQNFVLAIFGILILNACRKDDSEIIQKYDMDVCSDYEQPGEHFPAHPGSWWTYNVPNSNGLIYSIDSTPSLINGLCLPYFDNLETHVIDNNFYHGVYLGQGQSTYKHSIIYSLDLGVEHICFISFVDMSVNDWVGGSIPSYRRTLVNADTTVTTLNGDTYSNVIVMEETYTFDSTHIYLDYFALNIGLIKRDSIDYLNTSNIIEILTLDQYFINE